MLLFGSRYDGIPEARTTVTAVADGSGTRAYASGEIVTNPGSGFERTSELTGAAGSELQKNLEDLAGDFSPVRHPQPAQ